MEDTPATRQATKARIGPWYVLQTRNPAAPGMKYATLLALISKGHLTARSVVRGPTTHQLWRYAAHVRGVSREFGLCYSCGGAIEHDVSVCPHCQRSQEVSSDPDTLLETRGGAKTSLDVVEVTSHVARMNELNRQRVRGEQQAGEAASTLSPLRSHSDVVRRSDGRVVSAMELAAALQDDPKKALRGPRRLMRKVMIVLAVLAVVGGAGVFYFRPEYRAPTTAWLENKWTAVRTWVASFDALPGPNAPSAPASKVPMVAETPRPVEVSRVEQASPSEVSEKPAPPAPAPVNPALAMEQARKLYGQAIDAEAQKDFATAVKLYEQIKKLPSDTWQADLQLRLESAMKRVPQSSAAN
jgi:hypothetical protein